MKITASLVLLTVVVLMMIAAYFAGTLIGESTGAMFASTYGIAKGKVAIMKDSYYGYVLTEPADTQESYRVGRNIINNSYSNL